MLKITCFCLVYVECTANGRGSTFHVIVKEEQEVQCRVCSGSMNPGAEGSPHTCTFSINQGRSELKY